MITILGVDPGAEGALVFFVPELGLLHVLDMPTYIEKTRTKKRLRVDANLLGAELRLMFERGYRPASAAVEKVAARPQQGVSSMFAFGQATGIVLGALGALGVEVVRPRPQEWQAAVQVKGGENVKANARQRAMELFPAYAERFRRVKDSGRADAALMAYAEAQRRGLV